MQFGYPHHALRNYHGNLRREEERTVSDIILASKEKEIRRLRWMGFCLSAFYFLLWVGTMVLAGLHKWPGSTCN